MGELRVEKLEVRSEGVRSWSDELELRKGPPERVAFAA